MIMTWERHRIHVASFCASVHVVQVDKALFDGRCFSPQNLLDTLNFAFVSFARDDLAICARPNANVRCDARHTIGMNSRMAIVDDLGDC